MSDKKKVADQKKAKDELLENPMKQATDQFADSFQKMTQTIAGAMENFSSKDPVSPDVQSGMNQVIQDLLASSENLQSATCTGKAGLNEKSDGLPFIQGMIQSMLSKDSFYPLMQNLVKRYAVWLNEKKSSLPRADIEKYEHLFDRMQKLCIELESEREDDSQEVKNKHLENKIALMQDIQCFGDLPEDLMNGQAKFF